MKKVFWKAAIAIFLSVFWAAGMAAAAGEQMGMSQEAFDKAQAADMKAEKAGEIFVMSGKLIATDLQYNTAVIECPLSGRIFTVAGPLSPTADLKIRGKSARLGDFEAGAEVRVKWKATENGHLLLMLEGK
jgi:hypothetical protein